MKKAVIVLSVIALSAAGVVPASASDSSMEKYDNGGFVQPCSLEGINPAHHPKIFGNPATAASYGFVRSVDGAWHVRPGCRR
jgi:hypothetical protein